MTDLRTRLSAPPVTWVYAALILEVILVLAQIATGNKPHWQAGLFLVLALLLWLFIVRTSGQIALRGVAIVLGFTALACVVLVPGSSLDVNSYALYGQMVATYGDSPYVQRPFSLVGVSPWADRVSPYWLDSFSVYGPLFTAISAAVMAVANDSFLVARLGFQSLALLAYAVITVLLWRRTRRLDATLLFAANPIVLAFGINDAHCDMLVGAALLGGMLLLEKRHWGLAGVCLAAAISVKISAAPLLAGLVLWGWRRAPLSGVLKTLITTVGLSAAALVAVGLADYLAALSEASARHTRFSVFAPLYGFLTELGVSAATNARTVGLVASGTVAIVGLVLIARVRTSLPLALAAGLVSYQVFGAYSLAWYVLWTLPVLALVPRSRITALAIVHSSWIAVAYFNGFYAMAYALVIGAVLVRRRQTGGRPTLLASES